MDTIANICKQHLGTSQTHKLRHSGARARVDLGATMPEVQRQLGHANLSTTSRYVEAVSTDVDRLGDLLAAAYGLDLDRVRQLTNSAAPEG